ncbi:MAG: flavodoxin family protein [Lentisphaeria bacterium]|nr:flavodoxin family protein [Lentisphaeria bacterium]
MKVLAINGSPRAAGNTAFLLRTVLREAENAGMETELVQLGGNRVSGCRACMVCQKTQNGRCAIDDDVINSIIAKMLEADAIILGSPTYFADVTSEMKALIDRAGYACRAKGRPLARKVGAAVTVHRRGGALCTYDTMNHFLLITGMIVPGSTYWNMAEARNIGEAEKDTEAVANMEDLGKNIVWLLQKLHD